MSERITDERLVEMRADQQQFADWTDDADDRNDALELVAALRELQLYRKVQREVICRQCGVRDELGEKPDVDF